LIVALFIAICVAVTGSHLSVTTSSASYFLQNTSATTPAAVAIVSGVKATAPTASSLTVGWNAVNGAAKYQMQWASNSTFKSATTFTLTSAKRAVSGLKPGTTYYTRVRAISSNGTTGSWSATLKAATYRSATGRAAGAVPITGGTKAQTAAVRSYLAAWGKYSNVTSVTFAKSTAHLGYTMMYFNDGHSTILLRSSLNGTQLRQAFAHELGHATQVWVYRNSNPLALLPVLGSLFGHTANPVGALDMAADCMAQSNTGSKADLYYQTKGCTKTELSWAKLFTQGWKI